MLVIPRSRKRCSDIALTSADDVREAPKRSLISSSATLMDINIASETAKNYTLGKITQSLLDKAKRRVNVKLSHLIVDARPEFTKEEITPDSIQELVDRRIKTLNTAFKNNELSITQHTVENIKSASKLLPVVLDITEDQWEIKRGEEISFLLNGNIHGDKINELIDFSHIDTENWEDERVNALHLSCDMVAVYYACLGFVDIVYHPKEKRFKNVIFRLKGAKVSFLDGLTIHARGRRTPPVATVDRDCDDDKVDIVTMASSTKHPSLFKISELEMERRSAVDWDIASSNGKASAFFVPGLTSIKHYSELPKQHYFTGKCILTKLKHEDLINTKTVMNEAAEIDRNIKEEIEKILLNEETDRTVEKDLTTLSKKINNLYKEVDEKVESAIKSKEEKTHGKIPNSLLEYEKTLLATNNAVQVNCFVPNGNYMHINTSVASKDVNLSVLSIKKNERDRRLHTIATSSAIGVPTMIIHSSGRYIPEFKPDVDRATLSMLLTTTITHDNAGLDPTINSARLLSSILFDNNYNGGSDFVFDLLTMSSEILATNTTVRQRLAGRLAQEIYRRFDMHDDVLFPSKKTMDNKRAGNRQYEWHRPVSLPIRMFMEAAHDGNVDEQSLTLITEVLLPGFIDTVIASGAWAVSGVRSFLETEVAENFLLKILDKVSSNVTSGVGKSLLAIHFMAEAATNMGRCSISPFSRPSSLFFDKDTDFYIEPGLSFANHILSDIPPALFGNSGSASLSDVILDILTKITNKKRDSLRKSNEERLLKEAHDAVFTINVPGGLYATKGVVNISIMDPKEPKKEDGEEIHDTEKENTEEEEWVYAIPRAVTVVYDNDDGFKELLANNDLKASLEKRRISKPSRMSSFPVESLFSIPGVVGVCPLEKKDVIKHKITTLPGFGNDDIMSVDKPKTSSYIVEEVGGERVVFWEPLLSIASMRIAADSKLVVDPLKATMDNILKDGKIVVNGAMAPSGFEWLWKRLTRTPRSVVPFSPKPLHQLDTNRRIKFFVTKFGPRGNTLRRNGDFDRLFGSLSEGGRQEEALRRTASSSSTVLGPDKASSGEIKKFLQQDFTAVLTLILTRLMVVVSEKELPIIRKISNSVSKIMYNSLILALDPSKNLDELMDKIAVESNSNGIYMDNRGLYQSVYEATSEGGDGKGIGGLERNAAPSGGVGVSDLATLLNRINTKARKTNTNPTGPAQTQEQGRDNLTRAIDFSSRLVGLIQDSKKTGMDIEQQQFMRQKQQMIPKYMLSEMPKPLPGKEYTSGQTLYVPVNPKEILTDIQWLSVLSDVEFGTRITANARESTNSQSKKIEGEMIKLLENWRNDNWNADKTIETYERYAAELVELNRVAAANKGFVSGRYTAVSIDKYNFIVLARSLIDMKFLIKIPNVWTRGDWRGAIETAVELAFMSLKENVSKGILAASRVSMLRGASESLANAERMLQHTM